MTIRGGDEFDISIASDSQDNIDAAERLLSEIVIQMDVGQRDAVVVLKAFRKISSEAEFCGDNRVSLSMERVK